MIDGLRPYPEMKPSGVDWLGEVPVGWDVHRAKYAFREVDDRSEQGDEELLSVSHKTGVTPRSLKNVTMFMAESYEGHKVCRPGDIVVNTMWAWMAALGITRQIGIVSPAYGVYRPRSSAHFEPRFLDYLLRTDVYRAEYVRSSRGITTSRLRLYPPDFLDIPFIQPQLDEQRLIVRFLDWHGAQTAKLVRAKKKIIALLNEQKQAIIHRAVTRGLDPNAKLKPSGVPWLGDVPEGWEVKRLRNISRSITSGSRGWSRYAADQGPLFIRIANLSRTGLHLRFDDVVRLALPAAELGEAARTRTSAGDLLLSITAYIGSVAIVPDDIGEAYVSQHVACCRLIPQVNARWIGYVLLSPVGQAHGTLSMYGGTKQGLSLGDVKNYIVLLPPVEMQDNIADWIDKATRQISDSISAFEHEIALIQEFRTRLIADVVTGKLDVRAAAARLPEIAEIELVDDLTEGDDLDEAIDDTENEEVAA
ncbi:restriction endonuclease subunit S [Labrys monachus]|uniref:Type I restriction enzyme S subunit n=1 Tax=Labrys monachus TaxID=217067 RepID=A0ABU0FK35_9HYPH|nr:restriction endonuclease subunit S [Labrys monachus]MDQ0394972.1 type I restriction enzyme S subunit [Labrys monachus]